MGAFDISGIVTRAISKAAPALKIQPPMPPKIVIDNTPSKKCEWHDIKCNLKDTPLGPIAKALDKPWQAATHVIAQSMAGTPLEHLGNALDLGSHGQVQQAAQQAVQGGLQAIASVVPGLASVPGIGLAEQFAGSLVGDVVSGKGAGGAARTAGQMLVPALSDILEGSNNPIAQVLGAATGAAGSAAGLMPVTRADPAPPEGVTAVLNNQGTIVEPATPAHPTGLAPSIKARRVLPTFHPTVWVDFAADPRTVGGTQVWAVPQ